MKRKNLNTAVDLIALAGFIVLTATGLVLEYRLPEGSGSLSGAGLGPGSQARPVALLFGLTRHAWGVVHYGVALLLFGALSCHVYLHGAWFRALVRSPGAGGADPARAVLGVVGLLALAGAVAVPLVTPKAVVPRAELTGAEAPDPALAAIQGRTTLAEAAAVAGVEADALAAALGLPPDTSPGTRLGVLTRSRGISLNQVREAVGRLKGAGE